MRFYFGGSEVPSHRRLLADEGVEYVSLSYVGLRRKVKFARPWTLEDHYPPSQHIFLDSGCYSINKADSQITEEEAAHLATGYMAFAKANIDRVDMISEFDAEVLGDDWLKTMRAEFYDGLGEKFLPIWHANTGAAELRNLAQRYHRVGILQREVDTDLTALLNNVVSEHGTLLHGVAMTRMEAMRDVPWDSVGSTSWISPSQYGDTFVWTGQELKRYPKKYKEAARKRHRVLFTDNGFDAALIANDGAPGNVTEVLRLSIWSWRQFVESLSGNAPIPSRTETEDFPDVDTAAPEVPEIPARGTSREVVPFEPRNTVMLPVMQSVQREVTRQDADGNDITTVQEVFEPRSDSMRMCDTCFIKDKCPGFKAGSNCLYNIPIRIETVDDIVRMHQGLITFQTQRVMFMQMVEQVEGGYADVNLSAEIDRLARLIKQYRDAEREGFTLTVSGSQNAGSGFISSLLGPAEGARARALPAPQSADEYLADLEVEVLSES